MELEEAVGYALTNLQLCISEPGGLDIREYIMVLCECK